MLEALARHGVDCERCYERPYLKKCLGCGAPPTHEEPSQTLWRVDPERPGRLLSPAAAVNRGLPAYSQLGVGEIRDNWPWCPRWFAVYSRTTVSGIRTWRFISRAAAFAENGELAALVAPPWTAALLDLLDYHALVHGQWEQERMKRRREKTK